MEGQGARKLRGGEFSLLVDACAAVRLPGLPVAAGPWDAKTLDGGRFSLLAARHKVKATALAGLKRLDLSAPGLDLRDLARSAAFETLLRREMTRTWAEAVQALEDAGFRTLSLKGPALSLQLYGDPYAREYTDIDIIVDRTNAKALDPVMEGLGFLPGEGDVPEGCSDPSIFQSSHHIVYWRKDRAYRFEIHASGRIGERTSFGVGIPQLFEGSEVIEWEGRRIRTLSQADHRLFALAHGIQHEWCALHWLLDGANILLSDSPYQEELAKAIKAQGMERELEVSRLVAQSVFGVKVREVLASPGHASPSLRGAAEHCLRRMDSLAQPRLGDTFQRMLRFELPLASGAKAKLSVLAAPWKIPAQDALRQPLPRNLRFLHFVLRPFNVMGRRARRLIQSLLGDYRPMEILEAWLCLAHADARLRLLPYGMNREYIFRGGENARADGPGVEAQAGSSSAVQTLGEKERAQAERLSGAIARAARHPGIFDMSCLRRSLALRTLLARRGISGRIVFGVRGAGQKRKDFSGHAWLRVGALDMDSYGPLADKTVFKANP